MSALAAESLHEDGLQVAAVESIVDPLLDRVTIIGTREGGKIDCLVPMELIDHEDVPVKDEWAHSLAEQMKRTAEEEGGTGQQAAILLGLIEGEGTLKIIDGFHRDAGLRINDETVAYGTPNHDTSDSDRFDSVAVQSAVAIEYTSKVNAFLNGRSDKMPVIGTRMQILWAEKCLRQGRFSGNPELQEDLRDAIRSARETFHL